MLSNEEIKQRVAQIMAARDISTRNIEVDGRVVKIVVSADVFGMHARLHLHNLKHPALRASTGFPSTFSYTFPGLGVTEDFVCYTFFWQGIEDPDPSPMEAYLASFYGDNE